MIIRDRSGAPEETPPQAGGQDLAARGVAAHERAQRLAPDSYPHRHRDWPSWCRRQRGIALLAATLAVPAYAITAVDDPDRGHGPHRALPGDLYLVTDPHTGWSWRFIPDPLAEHGWLLLGACTHCAATAVPAAHVAGLADIGAHHLAQRRTHLPPHLPPRPHAEPPLLSLADPAHRPGCPYARPTTRPDPRTTR